ncbi:MAG: hypothetical protein LBF80_02855 [Spirochaetaceae bacterium]|jgi:hypothetical protein|nr:hypothetical protein [Spirochaetaceae bacterium]
MFIKRLFYSISIISIVLCCVIFQVGCENAYGKVGGADKTSTLYKLDSVQPDAVLEGILKNLSGVWYSHYAGVGRLDGYRIGTWVKFETLMENKKPLFPNLGDPPYTTYIGNAPVSDDYFVFYDDTVYGEKDDGTGGNGGWGNFSTRYIGIVRAVNIFNDDQNRGAIIIEYLQGCAPAWLDRWTESKSGGRPYFGIYYRVLSGNTIQMANAVNLAALYAGKSYYTETATLKEAVVVNTVENEAEFISWGVVIPQDRE